MKTLTIREIQDIKREAWEQVRIPTKSPGYNGIMPPGIPE